VSAASPSGRPSRKKAYVIVGTIAGVVVAVLLASFIYAKVINKADKALDQSTVDSLLAATTVAPASSTTGAVAESSTSAAPTTAAPAGADGTWTAAADSILGYRVKESINGFDTVANGRTSAVTGSLTIEGTVASAAEFTVDMTTFKSDEGRRDGQFNGRIMSVDQFPTATFVLTAPIDVGSVPADGGTVTATATGDLTLRGVTKSVTFELSATYKGGRIAVLGNIPVVFADYGIPNPSIATIVTEDNGLLEFAIVFDRAA
jgi:polyisoprenoid-binding protein YceI